MLQKTCVTFLTLGSSCADMIVLLGVQIPQECPQTVSDMVAACLRPNPRDRPTPQRIIHDIECSMAATQRNPFAVASAGS